MAKMMHLASGVRIVAVDTLDVIAANAAYIKDTDVRPQRLGVVVDAKRGQFFVAVYERQGGSGGKGERRQGFAEQWVKRVEDCVMRAGQFLERFAAGDNEIWLLGEGLVYYKRRFAGQGVRFLDEAYWWPRAERVYELGWAKAQRGEFADAMSLEPKYLRRPEAEENAGKSSA
jgi:tRNA A37 threonylcarbamoyladenosine modification protein TsaB